MSERGLVFLTGPSDLFFFRCGLSALELSPDGWVVCLSGTCANIAPDMAGLCGAILPGAEVVPVSTRDGHALAALADRFGRRVRLLAVSHLFGGFEGEVLALFDRDALILTENGIATYLPPKSRMPNGLAAPAAPDMAILPLSVHPGLGLPAYLAGLPGLRVAGAMAATMQAVRAQLRARLGLDWVREMHAAGRGFTVVAGTSLARMGIIDVARERDAYAGALAESAAAGGAVLWKPHPRAGAGGLPAPDLPHGVVEIRGSAPLELYLPDATGAASGETGTLRSLASSSLLTAALFHGMAPEILPGRIETGAHPHVAAVRALARHGAGG